MKKISSQPTNKGSADWFTGDVYVDGINQPSEQSSVSAGHVHFTPGARTAWHSHPYGQTLYVTDGEGRLATKDGVQTIRPGESYFIAPGEEHWHGAAADHFMSHIAVTEADANGSVAAWGDHVTDEEYQEAN